MSRNSRLPASASRGRVFRNSCTESLDKILEPLSIDKLKELIKYVSAQKKTNDEEEFKSFFAWRAKQTSIKQSDTIIIETINHILNKKECEEKEEQQCQKKEQQVTQLTQVTDSYDDDNDVYVPPNELLKQLQHETQVSLRECAPQNTPKLSNNDYSQTTTSCMNNPLLNSKLQSSPIPTIYPVTPFMNINLNEVDMIINQMRYNLTYFPVPQGFLSPARGLSLAVSPVSITTCVTPMTSTNNLTMIQASNMPITNQPQQKFQNNDNNRFNVPTETKQADNQYGMNGSPLTQFTPTQSIATQSVSLQIPSSQNSNMKMNNRPGFKTANNEIESKCDTFKPKHKNPGKGNFFISKPLISRMISLMIEQFITNNEEQDEKLVFSYYKQSVAMQINDKQINIFQSNHGLMIPINIDIHFKSNEKEMYLIAMENDQEFRDRVRWSIVDLMSAQQIKSKYDLKDDQLPQSSRSMSWYQNGIKIAPIGLDYRQIKNIVQSTRFKNLPSKTSKRQTGNDGIKNNKSRINEQNLKYYVEQSLKDDSNTPIHPVVVIKGDKQWIEWKRYIEIYDDKGYKQYVGISMRYYESNKQWRIECMDYDSGRVYYQHRLVSLSKDDQYNYNYDQLSKYITTTLEIYRKPRWY